MNIKYRRVVNKSLGFALLIGFYSSFFNGVAQSSLTEDVDFSVEPVTAPLVGARDQSERGEAQSLVASDRRMDQFMSEANQLIETMDTLDGQIPMALEEKRSDLLQKYDDVAENYKKLVCRVLDHRLVGQPPLTWNMVAGILEADDRKTYGFDDEDVSFVNDAILSLLPYCNIVKSILYMRIVYPPQIEYLDQIQKDQKELIKIQDAISGKKLLKSVQ